VSESAYNISNSEPPAVLHRKPSPKSNRRRAVASSAEFSIVSIAEPVLNPGRQISRGCHRIARVLAIHRSMSLAKTRERQPFAGDYFRTYQSLKFSGTIRSGRCLDKHFFDSATIRTWVDEFGSPRGGEGGVHIRPSQADVRLHVSRSISILYAASSLTLGTNCRSSYFGQPF